MMRAEHVNKDEEAEVNQKRGCTKKGLGCKEI